MTCDSRPVVGKPLAGEYLFHVADHAGITAQVGRAAGDRKPLAHLVVDLGGEPRLHAADGGLAADHAQDVVQPPAAHGLFVAGVLGGPTDDGNVEQLEPRVGGQLLQLGAVAELAGVGHAVQHRETPRQAAVALKVLPEHASHRDERGEAGSSGGAHEVVLRGPGGHEASGGARHVEHLVAGCVAPERAGEDALAVAAVLVRVAHQDDVELERGAVGGRRRDGELARARVVRWLVPKGELGVLAGLKLGERLAVGALDGEDREIGVLEQLPGRQPRAFHALANVAAPAARGGGRGLLGVSHHCCVSGAVMASG